ncbi:Aste57867_11390 [Aphanomyces stellatus]|uniref:Aste57867_11390 protein n=1 Tax=Aphanomyces stellatus TaxID=120398 RepID=A0A485KTD2_9STRA|nr:hypothetical protein As57867_011348 [Aphanomyces stellatus]VFT88251.1 Aste57867_11390 [Aphanomyces stellatus]
MSSSAFARKLAINFVPGWQYVDYIRLKGDATIDECDEDNEHVRLVKTTKPTHFEETFRVKCEKVEQWYDTCRRLHQTVAVAREPDHAIAAAAPLLATPSTTPKKAADAFVLEQHSIKQSFIELYKMLGMVQSFALINCAALRKILKAPRIACGEGRELANRALRDTFDQYSFVHAAAVTRSLTRLEEVFTTWFYDGDRILALAALHNGKHMTLNWRHHLTIAYLVNFILYIELENKFLPLTFTATGCLPLAHLAYVTYFFAQKDWGRQHRVAQVLHDIVLTLVLPVSYFHAFLDNYMTSAVKMNQGMAWSIRYFSTGEFLRHDDSLAASTCATNFYYTRVAVPLISDLPLWWRFLQSLRRVYELGSLYPQILNALIFALALVVVLFGLIHSSYSPMQPSNTLQVVWTVLFVLSSIAFWVWDVVMYWGRPDFQYLGDAQMYSKKWVYLLLWVSIWSSSFHGPWC